MRLKLAEAALFATLGALTFGAKVAMAGLPNIEPVTLFLLLFAVTFGWKALCPLYIYVLLEILVYGPHLWSLCYLYIWLVPLAAALALRGMRSPWGWAVVSGSFGLLFGALCAPVYLVTGGPAFALGWWLSGIPFDLLHAAGNFVLALVLFEPLRELLERLYAGLRRDAQQ